MPVNPTADQFLKKLKTLRSAASFLDQHAATMPRTLLRYAIEHLDKKQRAFYMGLKKAG